MAAKKPEEYTEAYLYWYWNIISFKIYIGYRYAYEGSPFDDFDIVYKSSSKNDDFWEDMEKGLIKGEILAVYTGPNAAIIAKEKEDELIRFAWDTFGRKNVYNRCCGGHSFSAAGLHKTKEQKEYLSKIKTGKKLNLTEEQHKNRSKNATISNINRGIKICPAILYYYMCIKKENYVSISKILGVASFSVRRNAILFNIPYMWEPHMSEESKKKMLETKAKNGYDYSKDVERNLKISKALSGVPKSEESKRKNSEAHKGKIPGNKGKKTKKLNWKTPAGNIVQMDKANAHKWHPDWILIE